MLYCPLKAAATHFVSFPLVHDDNSQCPNLEVTSRSVASRRQDDHVFIASFLASVPLHCLTFPQTSMATVSAEILASSSRWKLDVVGVLAVLGERNIRLSANLITSTALCYLPRLLPAPQGLLSISGDRIKRLPVEDHVSVTAVYNGNKLSMVMRLIGPRGRRRISRSE